MNHRLLPALLCLTLGLTACPPPQPRPRPRPVPSRTLIGRLLLPVDRPAREAVEELRRRAARGDGPAARAVAHYLVDVYDFARLTGDPGARRWLWHALGLSGEARRGAQATRQVLGRLRTLVGRLRPAAAPPRSPAAAPPPAARPASDPVGRALARLLRSDWDYQGRKVDLAARVKEMRSMKGGPLRYAALLRLYAPCAQAFRAAVLAPPAARPRILNHCLYALYELDPAPHLRITDAPPHPPWTAYRRGLVALLDAVGGAGRRPAETVARLRARDRRFFAEQSHRLPLATGGQSGRLLRLDAGRVWRGGAAMLRLEDQFVTGGKAVMRPEKRHFRVALSRLFFAHGQRTHLTVFAPSRLAVRQIGVLLERAADVGFYTLGLGGTRPRPSRVGYWRLTEEPPAELREVVISLAPSSVAARTLKNLSPRVLQWDRACARHGLGLVVRKDGVVPTGPDGQLEPVGAESGLGAAAVRGAVDLQGAFPGACGLWLAAAPDVTYGQLVSVVTALRKSGRQEVRAFRYLGLRLTVPKARADGGTFARRVQLRRAATITPLRLARRHRTHQPSLVRGVRPCYLDALDRLPARWARLEIQSTPDKTLVTQQRGTSPEEVSLNECVARAVTRWRRARGLVGLVQLQLRMKP